MKGKRGKEGEKEEGRGRGKRGERENERGSGFWKRVCLFVVFLFLEEFRGEGWFGRV